MKIYFKIFAAYTILLIFNSCENLNDPGEREYQNSVFFNLRAGDVNQEIYVYNSYPIEHPVETAMFFGYNQFLVGEANITIKKNNFLFSEFKLVTTDPPYNKKFYTNSEELFVYPDSVYSVTVEANGQTVSGSVKTIGNFEILGIEDLAFTDTNYNRISVSWEKCRGAAFYQLEARSFFKNESRFNPEIENIYVPEFYTFFPEDADDNGKFLKKLSIRNKADSIHIFVGAFDENTYKFFIEGIDKVNIDNSYGYIGSSTIKTIKKYFRN